MSEPQFKTLCSLQAALPDLAAEAKARAVEFEEKRKLAPGFADKLKRAGALKVLVPQDAGGLGGSLTEWLEMAMALAEADASTGWVMSHANICVGIIYASADPRLRALDEARKELTGKSDRYTGQPLLENPATAARARSRRGPPLVRLPRRLTRGAVGDLGGCAERQCADGGDGGKCTCRRGGGHANGRGGRARRLRCRRRQRHPPRRVLQ